MSSLEAIKQAIDDQNKAFDEFKKANDDRIKAIKAGEESKANEIGEKLTKIEADVSKFTELKKKLEIEFEQHKDRIEELEARSKDPKASQNEKLRCEHKDAFAEWVRSKGQSSEAERKCQEIQEKLLEKKDITIGTPSAGGLAVPEEISREINRMELKFSPVRRLVKVVNTGTSDYKELVNLRGAGSGWVGETGSRSKTDTPTFRERAPTFGELYAYPQVSEWSLDDIFFNVEAWLSEEVAEEFAYQEGLAVISGDGTNKPTGMTNAAPEATADMASPLRTASAYEYVDCANSASPSTPAIGMDCLIDLIYKLNSRYRAGSYFVMNSLTTGDIRKLKNDNGDYLWQPSTQQGQPDMLLGYPVETWEQMDDVGADNFPVAFGNFRRGYTLADRVGLRMTRDNVTNVGFVKFYIRRREGGIVTNNDAIKFLRTSVS